MFQQGGKLYVLDLPSEQLHALDVVVPDDGTRTRPRRVDARPQIRDRDLAQQIDFALSPNGKRVAFSARGDLFAVPVEYGTSLSTTRPPIGRRGTTPSSKPASPFCSMH